MAISDAVQRAIAAEEASGHPRPFDAEVLHGYIPEYSLRDVCVELERINEVATVPVGGLWEHVIAEVWYLTMVSTDEAKTETRMVVRRAGDHFVWRVVNPDQLDSYTKGTADTLEEAQKAALSVLVALGGES